MAEGHAELGAPIIQLIELIGGIDEGEDYQLLSYVSLHDMDVVHTQLELREISPSELWLKLRKNLVIRRNKILGHIATIEEQLHLLHVFQIDEEKRHSNALAEHEAEQKSILAKLDQAEAELVEQRESLSGVEYDRRKEELINERKEKREAGEKSLKTLRCGHREQLKKLGATRKELSEELNNFRRIPSRSRKEIWERKCIETTKNISFSRSAAFDALINTELGLNKREIRSSSSRKSLPDETSYLPSFVPKCSNCGAVFSSPPFKWLCPICLSKQHSQTVWEVKQNNTRCTLCLAAPLNRFACHHCRNCGRLVCSSCCSNRSTLRLLGFDGPEKVCDRCYESLSSSS